MLDFCAKHYSKMFQIVNRNYGAKKLPQYKTLISITSSLKEPVHLLATAVRKNAAVHKYSGLVQRTA